MRESRPVRYLFTPTGPYFSSQLPCASVAHQAIIVGDPNGQGGVLTSELRRIGGNKVEQETKFHVTLANTTVEQLNKAAVIGYTQMTDREILREGKPMLVPLIWCFRLLHGLACALIEKHGPYHFARRNCQHFAYALGKSIMGETVIKPDCDARYRFTQEILSFLALVNKPFTGIQDGWILPRATAVLVNVKETGNADTWLGQVEGSEEHGMFLRTHCIICCSSMPLTSAILRQHRGTFVVAELMENASIALG